MSSAAAGDLKALAERYKSLVGGAARSAVEKGGSEFADFLGGHAVLVDLVFEGLTAGPSTFEVEPQRD